MFCFGSDGPKEKLEGLKSPQNTNMKTFPWDASSSDWNQPWIAASLLVINKFEIRLKPGCVLTGGVKGQRSTAFDLWLSGVKHETSAETDWACAERHLIFVKCVVPSSADFTASDGVFTQTDRLHWFVSIKLSFILPVCIKSNIELRNTKSREEESHVHNIPDVCVSSCSTLYQTRRLILCILHSFHLIFVKDGESSPHTDWICVPFISRRTNDTFKDRRTRTSINQLLKIT